MEIDEKTLPITVCFTLCLLSGSLAAAPAFNDNPIAYGKVKVQSWKERRDFNIVKQDLDYSCGAASVATLLNNFYGQKLNEEEVLDKMDKTRERASFEDMQRIMPELGFEAKGYALSFEQLAQLKIPVIVYLKYRRSFFGIAGYFQRYRAAGGTVVGAYFHEQITVSRRLADP